MRRVLFAGIIALCACGTRPPQLLAPDRVESFCSEKEPRGTAIASILSSVADRPLAVKYPVTP